MSVLPKISGTYPTDLHLHFQVFEYGKQSYIIIFFLSLSQGRGGGSSTNGLLLTVGSTGWVAIKTLYMNAFEKDKIKSNNINILELPPVWMTIPWTGGFIVWVPEFTYISLWCKFIEQRAAT